MPACCWARRWRGPASPLCLIERQPLGCDRRRHAPMAGRWRCSPAVSMSCAASALGRVSAPGRPRSSRSRWSTSTGGGHVHYDSDAHGKGPFGVGVEQVGLRQGLLEAFLTACRRGRLSAGRSRGPAARQAGAMQVDLRRRLDDRRPVSWSVPTAAARGCASWRGSRVDRWAYDQQALTLVLRHQRPHRRHGARVAAARRAARDAAAAGPPHRHHLGRAHGGGASGWPACPGASCWPSFDAAHRRRAGQARARERPGRLSARRPACAAATWRRAWRWSAMPRTACTRSTPRASTWAWPTSARWPMPWWRHGARPRSRLRRGAAALRARAARRQHAAPVADRRAGARCSRPTWRRCTPRAAWPWTRSSACRRSSGWRCATACRPAEPAPRA